MNKLITQDIPGPHLAVRLGELGRWVWYFILLGTETS